MISEATAKEIAETYARIRDARYNVEQAERIMASLAEAEGEFSYVAIRVTDNRRFSHEIRIPFHDLQAANLLAMLSRYHLKKGDEVLRELEKLSFVNSERVA